MTKTVLERACEAAIRLHKNGMVNHSRSPQQFWALHYRALRAHRGYAAIVEKAEEIGWPDAWAADLETDRQVLLEHEESERFLWGVRETGTDLCYWTDKPWFDAVRTPSQRWFRWDGQRLAEVTRHEASRMWQEEE